jgi:hypothetical protein
LPYPRRTFCSYVSQIDEFPDDYFDIVIVDGQARSAFIAHRYTKVKSGGMLILDNSDIPHYLKRTQHYLHGFRRHSFYGIAPITGVVNETIIFTKDASET